MHLNVWAATWMVLAGSLVSASPASAFSVADGCSAYPNDYRVDRWVFDWKYYTSRYPDLGKAGINTPEKACRHWVEFGFSERRTGIDIEAQKRTDAGNPVSCAGLSPKKLALVDAKVFNWQFYLNANADLLRQGLATPRQACAHWLYQGVDEGRQAHPGFSARNYLSRYSDLRHALGPRAYSAAIQHYVDYGLAEKRVGYLGDADTEADAARKAERITISGNTANGPLYVSASRRTAGAIDSVMWQDIEFINSFDLGRQLQLAYTPGSAGECYNPTEAGGRLDAFDRGTQGASSSVLLAWRHAGSQLATLSEPAYWMRPGDVDKVCGVAKNRTVTASAVRFSKEVDIGYAGMKNVMGFQFLIDISSTAERYPVVPGTDWSTAIEAPTGYLAEQFARLYSFDPASRTLTDESSRASECIKTGSGINCEQGKPLVFVNNTDVAMGVCAVAGGQKYRSPMYGVFAFPVQGSPIANTYKWNVVHRLRGDLQGPEKLSFKTLISIGSLAQVQASMQVLYARGECFSQ